MPQTTRPVAFCYSAYTVEMQNQHHQQQINGLLIMVSVLIVGGLLLFVFSRSAPATDVPVQVAA